MKRHEGQSLRASIGRLLMSSNPSVEPTVKAGHRQTDRDGALAMSFYYLGRYVCEGCHQRDRSMPSKTTVAKAVVTNYGHWRACVSTSNASRCSRGNCVIVCSLVCFDSSFDSTTYLLKVDSRQIYSILRIHPIYIYVSTPEAPSVASISTSLLLPKSSFFFFCAIFASP